MSIAFAPYRPDVRPHAPDRPGCLCPELGAPCPACRAWARGVRQRRETAPGVQKTAPTSTRYQIRTAAKRCDRCNRPNMGTLTYCDNCRAHRAKLAALRRTVLHAKGLCTRCGTRPAAAGVTTCTTCRPRRNAHRRQA